jgi:PKD repeat protein
VQDNDGATGSTNSLVSVVGDSGPVNDPPTADFNYSCNELACSFSGSASNDSDGTIVSYQWSFGDGSSSSGVSRSHTFSSPGTYLVRLTVKDDDDATDTASQWVTVDETVVVPPPPSAITLSASGSKIRGNKEATLYWSGAATSVVIVYRDGASITTTSNDGSYTDKDVSKRSKSVDYQLCETSGGACSDTVTVRF